MGLRVKVSQRQRRLGEELRKLREQAAVPRTEICRQVGIQAPHLSNIEAGRTACPEPRLRALAEAYGCTNKPLIEALVEMTNASGKGWWSKFAKTMEQRVIDLAELESMATAHRSFQWLYVPGLLQTPAYMRALFRRAHPEATAAVLDSYVTFRLHRQQALTEPGAVRYHAVIHETAFHMNFADRETRREQLDYLLQLSRFPHITLQLLPFRAEPTPSPQALRSASSTRPCRN